MEKTIIHMWVDGNKARDHAFRAAELMQAASFLCSFKPVHHRYNASTAINALRKEAAMSLVLGRSYDAAMTRRVWQRHYKSLIQKVENQAEQQDQEFCAQCGRELESGEVVTCDTCDRRYQSR